MKSFTINISILDEQGKEPKVSISTSSQDNITDIDTYYICKALSKYANEMSRKVSRDQSTSGNEGKLIKKASMLLIETIYNRINKYIEDNNIDMSGSKLILYKKSNVIRLYPKIGDNKNKFKGLHTLFTKIKPHHILFDLLDIDTEEYMRRL